MENYNDKEFLYKFIALCGKKNAERLYEIINNNCPSDIGLKGEEEVCYTHGCFECFYEGLRKAELEGEFDDID